MKKEIFLHLKRISSRWEVVMLAVLCIGILLSHFLYTYYTFQFPEMDEQHYTAMVGEYYRQILHPSVNAFIHMMTYIPFRQPGFPLLVFPLLFITGIENSYKTLLFSNGIFFVVTVIAMYFLGKTLYSKTVGLLACMLFTGYGWSLFYLHFTYSETATTCFTVLSLLFLLRTEHFRNRKYALLFAIALGYGTLVRWVVPIFITGPLLLTLYQMFKMGLLKKIYKQLILVFCLSVAIAMLPYLINAGSFFGQYVRDQLLGGELWRKLPESRRHHFSLQSAAYYFKVLEQLNIFYFLLFIAGLFLQIFTKQRRAFLWTAFFIPYLSFSFLSIIKDDRYIVPIYPIVALISASCILFLKDRFHYALLGICGLLGIISFLGSVWGIGPMGKGLSSILLPMPIGHPRLIHFSSIVWPPTLNRTNSDKIMEILTNDIKKRQLDHPFIVAFFSVHPIDIGMYTINTFERIYPYTIHNFVGDSNGASEGIHNNLSQVFTSMDYLLIKDGQTIEYYFDRHNYPLLSTIVETLPKYHQALDAYEKIGKVYIPYDKSIVSIYYIPRNRKNVVVEEFINEVSKKAVGKKL